MPASIRMDDDLLARLKVYAAANDVSASAVVREALSLYLAGRQQTPYELGADLFGRQRSQTTGVSSLSLERKQALARELKRKYDRP